MRKTRHKVTFLNPTDIEPVALAQLGSSNALIRRETGLSECQINYRLGKAKRGEGLPAGQGYRTQWRNGTSPYYQQIARGLLPKMRQRIKVELPPKFIVVPAAQR